METKQDRYFILDVLDFVFQIAGKPLPCNLQRKLDNYAKEEESNVTLNIKKAIMININNYLVSDEARANDAFKIFETKKKELLKTYTPFDFLKLLSFFAYTSVSDFVSKKLDSPEIFISSMKHFLGKLRMKGKYDDDSWETLNRFAITLIEEDRYKNNYLPLRKSTADIDMHVENGFVLMIMNYVFDYYCRNLPDYLQTEFKKYGDILPCDPNIKNAIFVILNEVEKKCKLLCGIEPVVLYYYNLCSRHFQLKYFLEFCVCCSRKALVEYSNESKELSPKNAHELLVYILRLAKEDGKFTSLDEMNDAADLITEEDRDRIEHERKRRDISVENSIETAQGNDCENLISSDQRTVTVDCKCCVLT